MARSQRWNLCHLRRNPGTEAHPPSPQRRRFRSERYSGKATYRQKSRRRGCRTIDKAAQTNLRRATECASYLCPAHQADNEDPPDPLPCARWCRSPGSQHDASGWPGPGTPRSRSPGRSLRSDLHNLARHEDCLVPALQMAPRDGARHGNQNERATNESTSRVCGVRRGRDSERLSYMR